MRRRGKSDRNLAPIRAALSAAGCVVVDLGMCGGGIPDLLVFRRSNGLLRLLEVKNPETTLRKDGSAVDRKSDTAERQAAFARLLPVWRVTSVAEALAAMELRVAA